MKKTVLKIKKKFPNACVDTIERAFVDSYGKQNCLSFQYAFEVKEFLDKKDYSNISEFITNNISLQSLDELVIAFEYLVNQNDKKNNGVVYTPLAIRQYISKEAVNTKHIPRIIDPACGCGAFLISASQLLHEKYQIPYSEIHENHIWGCDIDAHAINKCKVLLELLRIQAGEKPCVSETNDRMDAKCKYNLIAGDALEILSSDKFQGKYDAVIGNPPYVRAKNIDENIKKSIQGWETISGNFDLYMPFFQLGVELLKENGVLGYISPNTYLQSLNGRALRNYIRDSKRDLKIIDFKETQKFADATHYTCITFVYGDKRNGKIDYAVCKDSLDDCHYTTYDISRYRDNMEWRFSNQEIDPIISQIENQQGKLDDYNIRNGLATLANELFFFDVTKETEDCYVRIYDGNEYKIEKEICINVAKPNIMRNEIDLLQKVQKAIYPYVNGKIIEESTFKKKYPCAYDFLKKQKEKLLCRDKGKIQDYPAWYAYGRTQGMNNQGSKILIPYMANRGIAIISEDPDLLFYCGYAVFSNDIDTLRILKILIESDIFKFYVRTTSKPYSNGYVALAKNYIKNFGIPKISNEDTKRLIQSKAIEREKIVAELYGLDYELIKCFVKKV